MSSKSHLLIRQAIWKQRIWPNQSNQPTQGLASWLNETGSLTKRLRNTYGTQLSVQVLHHQWRPTFIDESRLLASCDQRFHLIREVLLYAGAQPLILARTVLPQETIRIAQRNLSHLGTRPLGEVIFAYPDLERRRREFALMTPNLWSVAARERFPLDANLWGRRTLYAIHQQPLLVSEYFLPGWSL